MARIVKKAAERSNEILQKAQELFYQHGYRNTSVNMVIDALSISKGAFYHHFKSKEALLDCLTDNLTETMKTKIEAAVFNDKLNALEKLNILYHESSSYKVENIDFIMTITEALYKDDNLLLRYKFQRSSIEEFVPILASIFQQGMEEGVFVIENPVVMARTVLLFGISISEHNAKLLLQLKEHPEKLDEMMDYFMIYQRSVERMLNAPEGSVKAFNKQFFDVFANQLKDMK